MMRLLTLATPMRVGVLYRLMSILFDLVALMRLCLLLMSMMEKMCIVRPAVTFVGVCDVIERHWDNS